MTPPGALAGRPPRRCPVIAASGQSQRASSATARNGGCQRRSMGAMPCHATLCCRPSSIKDQSDAMGKRRPQGRAGLGTRVSYGMWNRHRHPANISKHYRFLCSPMPTIPSHPPTHLRFFSRYPIQPAHQLCTKIPRFLRPIFCARARSGNYA